MISVGGVAGFVYWVVVMNDVGMLGVESVSEEKPSVSAGDEYDGESEEKPSVKVGEEL